MLLLMQKNCTPKPHKNGESTGVKIADYAMPK